MKAWITARRIRAGYEDEFRRRWAGGPTPAGMADAYLLQREDDPRETLSLTLWESDEQQLRYRTSAAVYKRRAGLADVVERELWSRGFNAWKGSRRAAGRRPGRLAVPALLGAAGAGAFFLNRRRRSRRARAAQAAQAAQTAVSGRKRWLLVPAVFGATSAGTAFLVQRLRGQRGDAGRQQRRDGQAAGDYQPLGGTAVAAVPVPAPARAAPTVGAATAPPSPAAGQRRRLVRDVMTPNPETIAYDADAATAAQRMRDLNVGSLPVVADGTLAGIITDRDLALPPDEGRAPTEIRVQELMSELPVTVPPDVPLEEAAGLMADRQIGRLLVVEGTRLVGIISEGDLGAGGG